MKRKFAVVVLGFVVAGAGASPIINVAASGSAYHSIYAETPIRSYGSSNSAYGADSAGFYAGTGDYAYLSDFWTTSHDDIVGYDENGDPIYGTVTEDQFATAEAQAYAYAKFDNGNDGHGHDLISAEVYAYQATSTSATGSEAYANAYANSSSQININFDLSSLSDVLLSSSVAYGDGYLALYKGGQFITDTDALSYNPEGLYLQAGSYTLQGWANYGGAEFSVQASAVPVPEPISLVAIAVGGLFLRRRRSA